MTMSEDHLKAWESDWKQYRPFLISFAYRMTGSLSEAEDLVQDTFLECARVPRSEIRNPKSWLTKICANKGIDHLKSAYKRRETYPGTWLPDAIPDSLQVWTNLHGSESPEKTLIVSESLTTSFLLLAERLTPEEVLHDARPLPRTTGCIFRCFCSNIFAASLRLVGLSSFPLPLP